MTLHIHRAERADGLLSALTELMGEPLPDPFEAEVIAIPTRGMERWLIQQASASLGASAGRRDGVCANVDFPFPRRLVGRAVAQASGIDPDADPWLPEHAVWPLLEVVKAALAEPWMAALAAHLGHIEGRPEDDPVRRARRLGTVRHLADLFDRYAGQRPEMVRAWTRGRDEDGAGAKLAPDAVWQAELWRRLRERISVADPAQTRWRVRAVARAARDRPPTAARVPVRPDAPSGRPAGGAAGAGRRARGPSPAAAPLSGAVAAGGAEHRAPPGPPASRRGSDGTASGQSPPRLLGAGRARAATGDRHPRRSSRRSPSGPARPSPSGRASRRLAAGPDSGRRAG